MLPDDVMEAVERLREIAHRDEAKGVTVRADDLRTVLAHLLAREAEVERHVKMLADCFRMAGADPDGDEDWRIAPNALRAVTDLRRDYDEVLDWQGRAEALLRECLTPRLNEISLCARMRARITAHLSENSRG